MAERRSRCEKLNARAVEQGLAVEVSMVSTDAGESDAMELEPSPAFDMESLNPTHVSENEIQEEASEPAAIENLDTKPDLVSEDLAIDNPPSEAPSYFDDLDEKPPVESSEDLQEAPVEELEEVAAQSHGVDRDEVAGPVANEDFSTVVEEEESDVVSPIEDVGTDYAVVAAASYFGDLDEPVFEEPAPILDEPEAAPTAEQLDVEESSELEDAEDAALESPSAASPETVSEPEELSAELAEQPLDTVDDGVAGAEIEEPAPVSEKELIEQSEDLLAEAPEPIADAEVLLAAEELVDRIGPVVDIQGLPKTQPSRVLSKTTQQKPVEPVEPPSTAKAEETLPVAPKKDPSLPLSGAEELSPPKSKKKKKISLLDSYFKGL